MFFVVGAQKAGTTMIHEWLKLEGCRLPRTKETHFFSHPEMNKLGAKWYEEQFLGSGPQGEIDPEYLYSPTAPSLIKQAYPDAKIIVLLREPVERAYSQYNMTVMRGFETQDFYYAMNHEEDRSEDKNYTEHLSYIDRSIYVPQIKRFFNKFDRKQILFIKFNTLFEKNTSQDEYDKLCAFVGLKPKVKVTNHTQQANPASRPRSKWVNQFLWEKNSFLFLKKLIKIILPISKLRDQLSLKVYALNSKEIKRSEIDYLKVDHKIKSIILSDLRQLQGITNLDLSDWMMRYSDEK